MLITDLLSSNRKVDVNQDSSPRADYAPSWGYNTQSGERVSIFKSESIAVAHRAKNIISDDVAKLPLQMIRKVGRNIEQVDPDPVTRNMAYLLQIKPNEFDWTPFQLKKNAVDWLLSYGNTYIWQPSKGPNQLLLLPSDQTAPVFDLKGNLWYKHVFSNGKACFIPSVEIMHLLINPDATGFMGRGVITFARETYGRQIAAHKTQAKFFSQGFMPAGYLKVDGEIKDPEARKKVRQAFEEQMSGSENIYRLAIFDNNITEFKPIDIQLKDAQFLESIDATERQICNFFGLPEHMLNRGKEAYNSNEQKYIEYLQGTLDAYLVPWEEAARIKWLSMGEQPNTYFKFIREALLRMDSKARSEAMAIQIQNGMMTPNEAREKNDMSAYDEGDQHYMAGNIMPIGGNNGQK
jgi:HK97 family phage portal protein